MKKLLAVLFLLLGSVAFAEPPNQVGIDYVHQKVHTGDLYLASVISTNMAALSSCNILISPNAGEDLHLRVRFGSVVSVNVAIYDTPTGASAGTALVLYNQNRRAGKTLSTTASSNVAVATLGNLVVPVSQKIGSVLMYDFNTPETILDPTKKYLISIIPQGTGTVVTEIMLYKNN